MKKLRKLFINIKNKFTLIKLGVHFSRYALFESYRRNNSLIDLSPRHYYSYSKSMIIVFKWILNKYIKYLESNNIIISGGMLNWFKTAKAIRGAKFKTQTLTYSANGGAAGRYSGECKFNFKF
jgi:hypothetical protein